MENLVERISRLPKGVDESLFLKQLDKIQEAKKLLELRAESLKSATQTDEVIPYGDFAKFTAHLKTLVAAAEEKPALQTEIIRKLVHKIEITKKGFEIEFYVGKHRIQSELRDQTPGSYSEAQATRPLLKFLRNGGSTMLTNGGP